MEKGHNFATIVNAAADKIIESISFLSSTF
jgi:hypothetical protein